MRREILVSATPQESWVALLEDEELVEVMFDRPDQDRLVGDIFLGALDDLRIYNAVLTADEVRARLDGGSRAPRGGVSPDRRPR